MNGLWFFAPDSDDDDYYIMRGILLPWWKNKLIVAGVVLIAVGQVLMILGMLLDG